MALYQVEASPRNGRCAVATRALVPGECVLTTSPFVAVCGRACNWCFKSNPDGPAQGPAPGPDQHPGDPDGHPTGIRNPAPDAHCASTPSLRRCGVCRVVRYCSRRCQQEDWARGGHRAECRAWRQIPAGCASQTVLVVARMAARLWFATAESDTRRQDHRGDVNAEDDEDDDDRARKMVLGLVHHLDEHDSEKRRDYAAMTAIVLEMLARTYKHPSPLHVGEGAGGGKSGSSKRGGDVDTRDDVGSGSCSGCHRGRGAVWAARSSAEQQRAVEQLFGCVNCNAFTICDAVNQPVGLGLFPDAAMLNHACAPNCIVSFSHDRQLRIQVVQPVAKGEELTISYIDVLASTRKRRQELRSSYFFECDCARCNSADTVDTEEDAYLDGFMCRRSGCDGVVVINEEGSRAVCRNCSTTRDVERLSRADAVLSSMEARQSHLTGPDDTWRAMQQTWEEATKTLAMHPRNARLTALARTMGNYLIDHPQIPQSQQLALSFLLHELHSTEWIVPTLPLPSIGLLHFQVARLLFAQHERTEAIEHMHHTLRILACCYGAEHYMVERARVYLDELERTEAIV